MTKAMKLKNLTKYFKHQIFANEKVFEYLLLLLIFSLPLTTYLHSLFTLLFFIYSLSFIRKFQQHFFSSKNLLIVPLIIYGIYLLNLPRSESLSAGLFELEKRLPLLMLPISFMLIDFQLDGKRIFRAFVFILLFYSILCFGNAGYNAVANKSFIVQKITEREYYYFSYIYLTSPTSLDPIYFSFLINIAILVILFNPIFCSRILSLLIVVYLAFFLILVASKMGIICMCIIVILKLLSSLKSRLIVFVSSTVFLTTLGFVFQNLQFIGDRFKQGLNYEYSNEYSGLWNSSSQRMAIWNCAMITIQKREAFGYGLSNGQTALLDCYTIKGYVRGHEDGYNSHNEFMHLTLESGIVGLFVFSFLLVCVIFYSRRKNATLALFILLSIMYFSIEVLLARQKGVSSFSLFYCVVYLLKPFKLSTENEI